MLVPEGSDPNPRPHKANLVRHLNHLGSVDCTGPLNDTGKVLPEQEHVSWLSLLRTISRVSPARPVTLRPSRKGWELGSGTGTGRAGNWTHQREEQHQAGGEGANSARLRTGTHTGSEPSQSTPSPCLFAHTSHTATGTCPSSHKTYQLVQKNQLLINLLQKKCENWCFQNQTIEVGKLRLF